MGFIFGLLLKLPKPLILNSYFHKTLTMTLQNEPDLIDIIAKLGLNYCFLALQ